MMGRTATLRWQAIGLTALTAAALAGCATRRKVEPPAPVDQVQQTAAPGSVDSLWTRGEQLFRRGKWNDAAAAFERVNLELPPGDPRIAHSRFYLAETHLAQGEQLQAAREFRRVSDDTPNDPLAPEALLRVGDAYAELWRRPELDPTYGQTALGTYQELLNRFPNSEAAPRAQQRIKDLQEKFAVKQFKAAQYYLRLKAYDSAILYLKDLVASYPRTSLAPQALVRLVGAYRVLGYQEDVKETCDYLVRFHPDATGVRASCPQAAPGGAPAAGPATPATPAAPQPAAPPAAVAPLAPPAAAADSTARHDSTSAPARTDSVSVPVVPPATPPPAPPAAPPATPPSP